MWKAFVGDMESATTRNGFRGILFDQSACGFCTSLQHLPYLIYFALEMMWATYARDWFDRMDNREEI